MKYKCLEKNNMKNTWLDNGLCRAKNMVSFLLFLITALMLTTSVWAQQDHEIDVVRISETMYMLVGAGGNITASIGKDGVLLVDSGTEDMALNTIQAIRNIQDSQLKSQEIERARWGAEGRSSILPYRDGFSPPKPVRYILNTSAELDRMGGNEIIATSGETFIGGNVAGDLAEAGSTGLGASIYAREEVLFAAVSAELPFLAYPTLTYYESSWKLSHHFNGDGVRLIHMPAAITNGDSIIYFPRSDVIATGAIFSQTSYPKIDLENGGSIDGVLDALNYILEIAVPEFRTEGGTMIVPGYGRLSDSADVGYYRDMLTIIRNNIEEMISRGWSLERIIEERPTKAYDGLYDNSEWTAEDFIRTVYLSLNQIR